MGNLARYTQLGCEIHEALNRTISVSDTAEYQTCLQQQSHQCAVFFAGKNASFIVMKVDKDIFNPEL